MPCKQAKRAELIEDIFILQHPILWGFNSI